MTRRSLLSTRPILRAVPVAFLVLFSTFVPGQAGAESFREVAANAQCEARLKSIYDRGEFRARPFQGEWLKDSSGYTVQEKEPQGNQVVRATYDVQSGKRTVSTAENTTSASDAALRSPDGTRRLEVTRRGLDVVEIQSGQKTQVVKADEGRDVHYRNVAWSPDGKRILFVESDSTSVRERATLQPDDPSYPTVRKTRFARVGEKLETLRVGFTGSDGAGLTWVPLKSPAEGFYLGQVEWAGNPEEILIETFSRFRDRREFLIANVSGTVSTLYQESSDTWVESSQGKNSGLVWIGKGREFIVVSEQDGWRHAFVGSRDGKPLRLLTPGAYDIIDRGAVEEQGGWYYFLASPQNATQKYLYRVPLDGSGELKRITPADQPGTHQYAFSPDARWAFHTYSTFDAPPLVDLVEINGHRSVRVLEDNADIRARAKNVIAHPTEYLQLDLGKGISLDAWMIKPRDFDAQKKYPVVVYVYGEPHAQTVLDEWGAAQVDFHRVLADLGYLVVSIDNRGTPAPKGAAWRRAVFGSLGPLSTDEQETGLRKLAELRPFVDLTRVGIWGWSGGGSNSLNAMFRKPESYHVGVAVVPKPQPHLYNAWFQEIYMRTVDVNPDGYRRAAAINYADGLKGDLLIITGSGETNTHIQIIEGLIDRLVQRGKQFDYMVYPNRDHGLREGEGSVVDVRMRILRYFVDHLPRGGRSAG